MFKVQNNMLPDYIVSMFSYHSDVQAKQTRQSEKFYLPFCRTEKRKNSLTYIGAYMWNNDILPLCINSKSFLTFKKHLKTAMLENLL